MDIRVSILMVFGVVLTGWVIFCGIQFFRRGYKAVAKGNFKGHIRCEACGMEYEVNAEEFTKTFFVKSVQKTRTRVKNGAFINIPQYTYYARKFSCPHCGKKGYGQVLNINELQGMMRKPSIKAGIRWLIYMVLGGLLIMGIFQVPMHFANQAAQKRAEDMRQERYEDLKDRYGVE